MKKLKQHMPLIVILLSLVIALPAWADINSELIDAAEEVDTITVQGLLAKGADVNAKDMLGMTALMSATINGHADTVQALLDAGADVNYKVKSGLTVLKMALATCRPKIVELLKKAGAKE